MKRCKLWTILLLTSAVAAPALAAGTVEEITFFSDALGMEKQFQIYLPEDYETSGLDYPVVFFIHGMTSNHLGDHAVIEAVEDIISRGLVEPFILIKPDADCVPFADAGFASPIHTSLTNSELNGAFEDYFVDDMVEWIDAHYRTKADRDHRFVTGHSQGGYSAMRAALRHPEKFSAVAAHAGALALEPLAQLAQYMFPPDYPEGPPYEYRPDAGFVSKILFAYAAAFSPNLTNPPWYVDLPFDEFAQPDPEVWPGFLAHSNTRWAAELKASGAEVDIYFEVGSLEEMGADYLNLYFAAALDALELPYTFRWFEGDHHSHVGLRTPNQITFFMPLNATVELFPRIINPRRWWPLVQATIELPGDLDVEEMDVSTIAITRIDGIDLEQSVPPLFFHEIGDLNGNGRTDLTLWFSERRVVRAISTLGIEDYQPFDVTIEGESSRGWFLAATDQVRAVNLRHKRSTSSMTMKPLMMD